MKTLYQHPTALYTRDTHYCPGCGHGTTHRLITEALDEHGLQDRTVCIAPVGCAVLAYFYFDVDTIEAPHGRAPAVATGVRRARPDSIVYTYQGDGDLGAIGTAEIIHAANRGENITVVFYNNAIYGMTGGQMAPTTLLDMKTTTTPYGRSIANEGYPIRMCELINSLVAPVYIERVSLAKPAKVRKAKKAISKAFGYQAEGRGFTFVEVVGNCPTGWGLTPIDALKFMEEKMEPFFVPGLFRDVPAGVIPDAAKAGYGEEEPATGE